MDVQRETLRSLFDAAADSYDQVGVDFFQPIAAGLVAELDPQPGERALDLGCGRGAALLPIARAVGPTGSAVGGDLSPVMVAQSTALAAEEDLSQVEVLVVDAQEPELAESVPEGSTCSPRPSSSSSCPTPARRWPGGASWRGRVAESAVATFGPPDPTWNSIDALFAPYLPPQLLDARTSGAAGPFGSERPASRACSPPPAGVTPAARRPPSPCGSRGRTTGTASRCRPGSGASGG